MKPSSHPSFPNDICSDLVSVGVHVPARYYWYLLFTLLTKLNATTDFNKNIMVCTVKEKSYTVKLNNDESGTRSMSLHPYKQPLR